MGKSTNNAIFLKDSANMIAQKVKRMFTDPNHLRVEDPGTVEGNLVFAYLDAFDPDKEALQEMKDHYQRGGLGDGVVKQRLNAVLQALLQPIRERREKFACDPGEVMNILRTGSEAAKTVAVKTLSEVREAMLLE
jgi:tryptophanyl-tRNA synthetase